MQHAVTHTRVWYAPLLPQTYCTFSKRFLSKISHDATDPAVKLWQTEGVLRPVPTEALLKQSLRELFPTENMHFNKRNHDLRMPDSPSPLEIDIYIPSLNLYVEYQDPHHYTGVWFVQKKLATINNRDRYKKEKIESRGSTLIQVPCWWDGKLDSLAATIKSRRPDLLPNFTPSSPPIGEKMPENLFRRLVVPDIGELMQAVFVTTRAVKNNTWWMGEKYDGMRCCWHPKHSSLYSRSGIVISIPTKFKQHMPPEFIDGEIWAGKGLYQDVSKLNPRYKNPNFAWHAFRLIAFDTPNPLFMQNKTPFEERYKRILSIVETSHPFTTIANRVRLENKSHLETFVKTIMEENGEGVILRQMQSPYETGKSYFLLKIKIATDTEALVVDCDSERVLLQLPDGTRFRAPYPKQGEIEGQLPTINDVITFTFKRFSNGTIPVQPKVLRVRLDLMWDDIVANQKAFDLKEHMRNSKRWTGSSTELRFFFEEYARDNNFDPHNPDNWYHIQQTDFQNIKGAHNMLMHFNGSVVNALLAAFPEIGLDKLKFKKIPRHYWKNILHVREYFIQVAREKGFDPLIVENWYRFFPNQAKKWTSILNYYPYTSALSKAFPELHFEPSQFLSRKNMWLSHECGREFFLNIAQKLSFDPLVATNWKSVPVGYITSFKGGASIRTNYGSYSNALRTLFPELQLDKKFYFPNERTLSRSPTLKHAKGTHVRPKSSATGNTTREVRLFFEEYAKNNNFDPHNPNNWYKISQKSIHRIQGAPTMLRQYDGNVVTALLNAFPEIGLDKLKFSKVFQNFWKDVQNVKDYFIQLAKENGFDPLTADNWYSFPFYQAKKIRALSHVYPSYAAALIKAFPEVNFDETKFQLRTKKNTWLSPEKGREFFCNIAKALSFDLLVAANWYSIPASYVASLKGGSAIIKHHGSYHQALSNLFPEVPFDLTRFPR